MSALGASGSTSTRTTSETPDSRARRRIPSLCGPPAVTARTGTCSVSATRRANSSAHWSLAERPPWGSWVMTPVRGSASGHRSTRLMRAAMKGPGATSGAPHDDAVATERIVPGDGAFLVADHVAGAALEAFFVVEQNAALRGRDEESGRTRRHALSGGTALAHVVVDHDVCRSGHPELHGGHAILEGRLAHPKVLQVVIPSRVRLRSRMPRRLRSWRKIARNPGLGAGFETVNNPCATSQMRSAYWLCILSESTSAGARRIFLWSAMTKVSFILRR